ncbi:molybdate transport system ATP-binding protein [Rhizobium sp. PP-F2F-G48]|uniref:molybdenum ABC transporter ATP-binding protein n=1 Tax=Rhizobium sp. PP-F2F-G48 TaxID=2135651 RepID=UPI001043F267|nr:molybdenum ABC transporter ATP-binding protein [Rhizobium sp. PP-F2F-G48]TCM53766.1 molybdate transport system ATP-binding protein [Rhizobium sp. PP-F2F-G48]
MTLDVSVRQRLDAFSLDIAFSAEGGITALFGRSGSGKTSLIRIVAGLIRPDEGHVRLDGETIVDTESRTMIPPHRRRFGTVFQEGRLFPHLSVRQNLLYGRWFSNVSADTGDIERIVDLLGIAPLLARPTANLSGGEKQRVAIGRALLARPRLLLMDEPLAALDDARKAEILPYLERLRDETDIPILYVSHSVAEVTQLADRVLMIENGRLAASGTASDMLSLPGSSEAISRREAGTMIEAIVASEQTDPRIVKVVAGGLTLWLAGTGRKSGQRLRLRIAARDILLATRRPEGLSALNIIEGIITGLELSGHDQVDVALDCAGTRLTARITSVSAEMLGLVLGMTVHAVIKTVALDP